MNGKLAFVLRSTASASAIAIAYRTRGTAAHHTVCAVVQSRHRSEGQRFRLRFAGDGSTASKGGGGVGGPYRK